MSAYEELAERCRDIAIQYDGNPSTVADFILSEVLETLRMVTPSMTRAFHSESCDSGPDDQCIWIAMLRASPISPPGRAR